MISLGGNIELVGFKDFDPSELIILKKIIGNSARKFAENVEGYEKLTLHVKPVHGTKFEVQAKMVVGSNQFNADDTHKNIFVVVSEVLKKLEAQSLQK